jgi:hypothetical protein
MTATFYQTGLGDRLVDEATYPLDIKRFLTSEERLLLRLSSSFDTLVEVGCMTGRHLQWSLQHGKSYIGIEPVGRYASEARRAVASLGHAGARCHILTISAEWLHTAVPDYLKRLDGRALFFFPFNSFGNAQHPEPILRSLSGCPGEILISSYRTSLHATRVRQRYYERCRYGGLRCYVSRRGVRFRANEGLNTVAYRPSLIVRLAKTCDMDIVALPFSTIGLAYASRTIASQVRDMS